MQQASTEDGDRTGKNVRISLQHFSDKVALTACLVMWNFDAQNTWNKLSPQFIPAFFP
jgi:hypothetical protein